MNFTSSPFERMMKEVPHPGWDNDDPCKGSAPVKKSVAPPSEQSGFECEIKQYITDNIFSCACVALCRAGVFCFPDFETKCPEVRCRSPPLLHFVSDQPRTN